MLDDELEELLLLDEPVLDDELEELLLDEPALDDELLEETDDELDEALEFEDDDDPGTELDELELEVVGAVGESAHPAVSPPLTSSVTPDNARRKSRRSRRASSCELLVADASARGDGVRSWRSLMLTFLRSMRTQTRHAQAPRAFNAASSFFRQRPRMNPIDPVARPSLAATVA